MTAESEVLCNPPGNSWKATHKWCIQESMRLTPLIAIVLIGFAATVAQILVLRELLTVFSGSELAVAVVLAAWLFWTGLGALFGGKISQYGFATQALFGYLQNCSGLTLTATILFIRLSRLLFHVGAGELVTLRQISWSRPRY